MCLIGIAGGMVETREMLGYEVELSGNLCKCHDEDKAMSAQKNGLAVMQTIFTEL
jgi:hypothetical protein